MPTLYIIPSFLAPDTGDHIPIIVIETIRKLDVFIVERTRTARRFIRSILSNYDIDRATFIEIDKHNLSESKLKINNALTSQANIGLLSEAGAPCIADPGAIVVNMARKNNYKIRPLAGPSSIMLALMASGMNGQQFSFHGYLPIEKELLIKKLKEISRIALSQGSTQLFIETPYRNKKLVQQIMRYVDQKLYVCLAKDLTGPSEEISTLMIKNLKEDSVDKTPTIYCIGKVNPQ